MLSLALQPATRVMGSVRTPALNYRAPIHIPKPPLRKNQLYARPNTPSPHSKLISDLKISCESRRNSKISASAVAAVEAVEGAATEDSTSTQPEKEKLGVVVKQMPKPRLVLKFIWMEKNIGLGLDQLIPGEGTVPLSPYYFWPRKDAWEELKVLLESKPWISQKQMIILLNQATDIINLWQQSGGDLA